MEKIHNKSHAVTADGGSTHEQKTWSNLPGMWRGKPVSLVKSKLELKYLRRRRFFCGGQTSANFTVNVSGGCGNELFGASTTSTSVVGFDPRQSQTKGI